MGHLVIAYDLCVIMIGLSALSIAGFWASKSKEAYLRNFCILYACYTAIMIVAVLRKYSFLNIANLPSWYGYFLSGINIVLSSALVVASIYFLHEIYQKVIQGKSNSAIAGELFISLATVKTHLNNIYKKMGLDGRFDLISRIRSR